MSGQVYDPRTHQAMIGLSKAAQRSLIERDFGFVDARDLVPLTVSDGDLRLFLLGAVGRFTVDENVQITEALGLVVDLQHGPDGVVVSAVAERPSLRRGMAA